MGFNSSEIQYVMKLRILRLEIVLNLNENVSLLGQALILEHQISISIDWEMWKMYVCKIAEDTFPLTLAIVLSYFSLPLSAFL